MTKVSLPVVTTVISFMIGFVSPLELFANAKNLGCSLNNSERNAQLESSKMQVLAAQLLPSFELTLEDVKIANFQDQVKEKINSSASIPVKFQSQTIESVKLKNQKKVIALTFDDGPWPDTTNNILYVLKKNNIKATFFMVGRNVQNYPDLAKNVVQQGHAVGNHSWSHPYSYHSEAGAAQEIDQTTNIIYQVTGAKTAMFRPPGGFLNNGLAAYAKKEKQVIVMWSSDSQDYRSNSQKLLNNSLQEAASGGIVLMHDGGGNRWDTLVALPYLIDELKKQGYEFVTIPELLKMGNL